MYTQYTEKHSAYFIKFLLLQQSIDFEFQEIIQHYLVITHVEHQT